MRGDTGAAAGSAERGLVGEAVYVAVARTDAAALERAQALVDAAVKVGSVEAKIGGPAHESKDSRPFTQSTAGASIAAVVTFAAMGKVAGRSRAKIVGVISDTHGLMRAEALAALAGSDLILHAGDIGALDILAALRAIAPVVAVCGNNDRGAWAAELAETAVVDVDGTSIYLLHDRKRIDLDPKAAGFAAVVSGHSHKPGKEVLDGVLYFNPGSAGPRRFRLPIAVGRLKVRGAAVAGEWVLIEE
jgi:putative phosphoesterase